MTNTPPPPPRKRIKAHDLRICTWNVRSLNKLGAISQLETVLEAYKTEIIALQEMRWTGQGQTNLSSCDIYYSGHASRNVFRCGFAVSGDLSELVSRFTPVDITLILPVLLYGAETWTLTSSDEEALGVFERKILRKIYGPFCYRGEWRIRWNQELYDIYDDIGVVKRITIQRLRWLGHVARMDSSNQVRKIFESEPGGGCRRQGRPPQRWAKQVGENLRTLGI